MPWLLACWLRGGVCELCGHWAEPVCRFSRWLHGYPSGQTCSCTVVCSAGLLTSDQCSLPSSFLCQPGRKATCKRSADSRGSSSCWRRSRPLEVFRLKSGHFAAQHQAIWRRGPSRRQPETALLSGPCPTNKLRSQLRQQQRTNTPHLLEAVKQKPGSISGEDAYLSQETNLSETKWRARGDELGRKQRSDEGEHPISSCSCCFRNSNTHNSARTPPCPK